MYAWSNFVAEVNEHGQPTKTIKAGEKISQGDLGVSDADWKAIVDAGAIRKEPYPENLPTHVSPMEYERSKIVPKTDRASELRLPRVEPDSTVVEEGSVLDKALGLG